MLASGDERANTLLEDLSKVHPFRFLLYLPCIDAILTDKMNDDKDPLAKEIINRVNNSPYGVRGRGVAREPGGKTRAGGSQGPSRSGSPPSPRMDGIEGPGMALLKTEEQVLDLHSTQCVSFSSPSHWGIRW